MITAASNPTILYHLRNLASLFSLFLLLTRPGLNYLLTARKEKGQNVKSRFLYQKMSTPFRQINCY